MLAIIDTLLRGARARAGERLRDGHAVELLDQKIRDAEAGLGHAKRTLASLVVRLRRERAALGTLEMRLGELENRARQALAAGRDDLAGDAAEAIAEMENERTVRRGTVERVDARATRMRLSVERAHRRLVALRQGAMTARSVDAERRAQGRLVDALGAGRHGAGDMEEAEALVARVLGQDDPLEEAEVRAEIERDLSGEGAAERLAEAGFGARARTGREDVLARLRRDVAAD